MVLRHQHKGEQQQQQQRQKRPPGCRQSTRAATRAATKAARAATKTVIYCDFKAQRRAEFNDDRKQQRRSSSSSCDQNLIRPLLVGAPSSSAPFRMRRRSHLFAAAAACLSLSSILFCLLATPQLATATTAGAVVGPSHHHNHQPQQQQHNNSAFIAQIIADQQQQQSQHLAGGHQPGHAHSQLSGAHVQPSFVYGPAQTVAAPATRSNRTTNSSSSSSSSSNQFNFSHIAYDELTNTIYVGGTNWLLQLSGANLKAEHALKVGPAPRGNSRDCAGPTDCRAPVQHVDPSALPLRSVAGSTAVNSQEAANQSPRHRAYSSAQPQSSIEAQQQQQHRLQAINQQLLLQKSGAATSLVNSSAAAAASFSQLQNNNNQNNNYNKILALDLEARQLIVCGSLNQGACRKHQLGQLSNYSELIPLPVASNDEHSSSVAFIPKHSQAAAGRLMYVAATNSRLDTYRDMVPAISARYLEPASKAMQIIESSFADSARVDISFELRDYYLVNYVYAFQHAEFVYFATVQRRSPLRQLEEWGFVTRLARLCLADLSFQSYTEMTLECTSSSPPSSSSNRHQAGAATNYNLLQDAQLISASSELIQQLNLKKSNQVLATVFAQSKDHSTRAQSKSALCLFPMELIEQRFNENIHQCYNGTSKSRNMNYIGGSVSDCPRPGSAGGNIANFCSEPLKLNGSLALTSRALISYEDELLTAVAGLHAPTSPLSLSPSPSSGPNYAGAGRSPRAHQVLILGTASGTLKRVLVHSGSSASEFDSIQLAAGEQAAAAAAAEPVLADLHLSQAGDAIAGTASRIVRLKVNGCRSASMRRPSNGSSSSSVAGECQLCAQLQDPFCGWCSASSSCQTRDECLALASQQQQPAQAARPIQWSPFDQIKCNDYKPIEPRYLALQTPSSSSSTTIDVNVRLPQAAAAATTTTSSNQLAQQMMQLAQAQFVCHFDYLKWANRSMTAPLPRVSGATTKAAQARLNPHTGTVSIGCPLPAPAQRPSLSTSTIDQTRVRLSVRLAASASQPDGQQQQQQAIEQLLGLTSGAAAASNSQPPASRRNDDQPPPPAAADSIQRELTLYDCSVHTSCRSCLSAGSLSGSADDSLTSYNFIVQQQQQPAAAPRKQAWSCAWCPLSNRCTFNASHSEFGCAASAIAAGASGLVISTTPQSAVNNGVNNLVRASHLAQSLDQAQASVFGISIERLGQCPFEASSSSPIEAPNQAAAAAAALQPGQGGGSPTESGGQQQHRPGQAATASAEILIPSGARRSIQVQLDQHRHSTLISRQAGSRPSRLECLLEIEGAKARLSARFVEPNLIVCQENTFTYQEEVATLRGQLQLIQLLGSAQSTTAAAGSSPPAATIAESSLIETADVLLYKCHLFGVNPPALVSTVGAPPGHHSSVAWRAHELLQAAGGSGGGSIQANGRRSTDCSLCLNADRKYQCAWCASQAQCRHSDQCPAGELPASTCPPPRIDSIHPTGGPLEGGTLLTIEGSNLGSNEREIQDKITVGGEPCQLVMYSVSTRIVCKTGPSLHGPQAATVFVGNRAGITSAYEKFHYKAVHLTDVNPRFGPVSGGTRLHLSGSNLNIGSRVQIFLDEIPCTLDTSGNNNNENHQHHSSGNQISCITAPNSMAAPMRITKLTLMIDNSTHHLPYPFTYQPDPIITSIEPAESFVAGGRLILVMGQHLASPQSSKLMVYHEHRHQIVNATTCITQNDTLITCLTPAISRELLAGAASGTPNNGNPDHQGGSDDEDSINSDEQPAGGGGGEDYRSILSYQSGGLKLKMSLFMDDVKSVRNLDEYYHHLPHYLTYYEDPQLFKLQQTGGVIDFNELAVNSDNQQQQPQPELTISGENLQMKQLDQDMLISIGIHICLIKTITANQVVCEPPKRIAPVSDEYGQLLERPLLPIVGLIGSNLRFSLGFMRYSSKQYQFDQQPQLLGSTSSMMSAAAATQAARDYYHQQPSGGGGGGIGSGGLAAAAAAPPAGSPLTILITLSVIGFIVGFGATLMFALSRFRQSKAEREYKRIQLQMGSLDINGQPTLTSGGGLIFDKNRLNYGGGSTISSPLHQGSSAHKRALDYIGSLSSKKLLYQLTNGHHNNNNNNNSNSNHHSPHQVPSFPSSPLTDVSSLTGGNPLSNHHHQLHLNPNQQQQQLLLHQHQLFNNQHHQQHVVKLSNNGTISNSTYSGNNHIYSSANTSSSSSQSSPNSNRDHQQQQPLFGQHPGGGGGNNLITVHDQQHGFQSHLTNNDKNMLVTGIGGPNGNSRNFNWTQDAPSTIVPYAVIEACNLTLDGKNPTIKEFV